MKRSHRLRLPAIAVATVAAVAVAACSSGGSGGGSGNSSSAALIASAPGITATTITVGSHQPLTGPAAPGYSEIAPASAAYFAYVNAHGGVYGRTICTSSTLSNWWLRIMPRVSFPAAPASERKHGL